MASNKKKKSASKKKSAPETEQIPCPQFKESGSCSYGDKCKFAHHEDTTNSSSSSSSSSSRSKNSHGTREDGVPLEPIDAFFAHYPNFNFQRNDSFWNQFRLLMRYMVWGGSESQSKRNKAKARFQTSMVEQFNYAYGTNDKSLESWQRLCRILGLGEPTTLKEARTLVQRTHVNLCDLTEHPVTGKEVKVFPSVSALRKYTIRTGKIFPKDNAKSGGLLKKLLREIINVSPAKLPGLQKHRQPLSEQAGGGQSNMAATQANKKNKKKKKNKSNSIQAEKPLTRTDSGVHVGDSFPLNGVQYHYPGA